MPATVHPDIDLDVLRSAVENAESMVRYYERDEDKALQNAALTAAGLKPIHSEATLAWDRTQAVEYRRRADCLRAVIAYFEVSADQAEAA